MAKWKDTHFYPGVIKEVMDKSRLTNYMFIQKDNNLIDVYCMLVSY
jgi:hypothetical protein